MSTMPPAGPRQEAAPADDPLKGLKDPRFAWLTPGAATAVLAVAGVLTYLILYYGCVMAYEPLGVEPADVGLDYANLLAGSGAAGLLLLSTAIVAPLVFLYRGRNTLSFSLIVILVVIQVLFYLGLYALQAPDQIRDGKRPSTLFGFPFPWDAKVAHVTWAKKSEGASELPTCLLYLG